MRQRSGSQALLIIDGRWQLSHLIRSSQYQLKIELKLVILAAETWLKLPIFPPARGFVKNVLTRISLKLPKPRNFEALRANATYTARVAKRLGAVAKWQSLARRGPQCHARGLRALDLVGALHAVWRAL